MSSDNPVGIPQQSVMPLSIDDERLVVAISSRALFDLDESDRVFVEDGLEAYRRYQIEREEEPLAPGDAFPMVKKLLHLNTVLGGRERVEVVLLSRNSADTGLRVLNSARHHGLEINKAAFCGGAPPYPYIRAFGCDLFLSTNPDDVRKALEAGVAAATILPGQRNVGDAHELRIAFDGDAVLFSDEAERVYQEQGLAAFHASEAAAARKPLEGGPFRHFLASLHRLQQEFPAGGCPIRTALVTARSVPAHERVIHTLRAWDIRLDESLFLGGETKAAFLKAFGADLVFDDQERHCAPAADLVATGHVPHGVRNEA